MLSMTDSLRLQIRTRPCCKSGREHIGAGDQLRYRFQPVPFFKACIIALAESRGKRVYPALLILALHVVLIFFY
jgi:hypothetical protein